MKAHAGWLQIFGYIIGTEAFCLGLTAVWLSIDHTNSMLDNLWLTIPLTVIGFAGLIWSIATTKIQKEIKHD